MIKLLLLVLALIAGIIVGPELAGNQGYVLISTANQTIEMSLTTLVVLIVALFAVFLLLEFILKRVFSISSSTRGWFSGRKVRKARIQTSEGLLKVTEGDWKPAEKLLTKSAKFSDAPLLNYLAAAEAAQGLGKTEQRDEYLKQAAELDSQNLAVALTRAKLQIRQQQFEQALATLQEVQQDHARNPIVLGLLQECYLKLEDWKSLLTLLPQLMKAGVISQEEAAVLDEQAQCGQMQHLGQQNGTDGLVGYWNNMGRKDKQNPALVACFIKQMMARHADSDAYPILRDALKKSQDERLISLVPQLNLPDRHPAIVKLQELLRQDGNNAVTHSALGQMLMAEGNWQEAKEHFERAVAVRPDMTDYAHLVATLEQLDDKQGAAAASRQALELAQPSKQA
ncbi:MULTISPECIES: heme biosynthesis protein HemY [unclassified Photobacterium]|uniref:heme biosynthesis protein HemY n=1 Tax=unclassified Photobacterium TaxID=2628852 RepID=UPI000D15ACF8|nr:MULTISPECIES: heme biosynthesis HemY N-terminal domain-containing protein [unclassified Photobacterium]PSV29388.1 heme biosynthesis protein HemY [Photobacterium sp. GB-72]PSV51577.1 heme biosynthesis protein HemY [Photobacterium sp. GB-1]